MANKIRNVHSPAGMEYSTYGTNRRYLKDCPKCKYGTIDKIMLSETKEGYKCADCGAAFSKEEIETK